MSLLSDPIKLGLLRTAISRYRHFRRDQSPFANIETRMPRSVAWAAAWRQARNIEDCGCGD